MSGIEQIVLKQHTFYKTHKTKELACRKQALRQLRNVIHKKENTIQRALYKVLHKHPIEFYMSEITCTQYPCIVNNKHVKHIQLDDSIMKEEIFAPLLPIITYTSIKEAIDYIQVNEKPLVSYLSTTNKLMDDTIVHFSTSKMGFVVVGASGMGSYHGYERFKTFSHKRSIVEKSNAFDLSVRYTPILDGKKQLYTNL